MDYTRKSTKNNIYDGFGQDFGRVARKGKEEEPVRASQSLGSQTQSTFQPAVPHSVEGFDSNTISTMYNNGFNQSGYNNQPPAWYDQYQGNQNNAMNSGYYPSQPMYDGSVQPPYGQSFGNRFPFPPPQMGGHAPGPCAPYGNISTQPGLMGPPPNPYHQYAGPVGIQMQQQQPFVNQFNPVVESDDSNLVPPGMESETSQTSAHGQSGAGGSNNSLKGMERGPKVDPNSSLEIKEGLVTLCCKEYGVMGTDVFFDTSSVRGNILPNVGDLVLIEAEKVEGMKFPYVAKRVQVLKLNAVPISQMKTMQSSQTSITVQDREAISSLSKPLRNPPPPPILSKVPPPPILSKSKSSRSRSRSRDRHLASRGDRRSRSPYSPHHRSRSHRSRSRSRSGSRNRRRRSKSRSLDRRRRRSRSRDSRERRQPQERSRRSESNSKKDTKKSQGSSTSKDASNSNPIKGLNIPVEKLLEDSEQKVEGILKLLQNEDPFQNEFFKPTFVELMKTEGQVDLSGLDKKDSNKIDLIDYNIWGIPELPKPKSSQPGKIEARTNLSAGATASKPSKSKQISIKLGYVENKSKAAAVRKVSATATKEPVVRYSESTIKSKQDLFKDHVIGAIGPTETKSHSSSSTKEKFEVKIHNDLKTSSKHPSSDSDRRKHSESSRRSDESRDRRKAEERERSRRSKKKQDDFEKVLDNVDKRRKSPAGSSRHHGDTVSSRSDKAKSVKSPATRRVSPKVSLVISSDRNRSPTPTEDEILERERQIKLREMQLEEERLQLERRMLGVGSRSPDVVLLGSPSPKRNSSRSPDRRRGGRSRRRRSRKSRSNSRSRSRGRPSDNERLVLDLGFRHSMGQGLIELDGSSPEKASYSGTRYRGLSMERDIPVTRRVREISPEPERSRDDPSLVLRLGRILRNGHGFVCYVCGKKGHHGSVCWFKQPGVKYPGEDEEEPFQH